MPQAWAAEGLATGFVLLIVRQPLLRLAHRDAEAMGIPEAAQILAIQSRHNLT